MDKQSEKHCFYTGVPSSKLIFHLYQLHGIESSVMAKFGSMRTLTKDKTTLEATSPELNAQLLGTDPSQAEDKYNLHY